jgi:uncharacterized LabA/DUF88 family protein
MNNRSIAIMVDGGYFLKRLPRVLPSYDFSVDSTTKALNQLCRTHVERLVGNHRQKVGERPNWLHYVYRVFYYDAAPYSGKSQHPFTGEPLDFSQTRTAVFRNELFQRLRRQRKLALRLGEVVREGDWRLSPHAAHKSLRTKRLLEQIALPEDHKSISLTPSQVDVLRQIKNIWDGVDIDDPTLSLRQKGVDMRLGLDVASIALKGQASIIVLVAGDADFVPAAKLARREGLEVILDPMWQNVNDELFEHIDGLHSGLARPNEKRPAETTGEVSVAYQPTPVEEE